MFHCYGLAQASEGKVMHAIAHGIENVQRGQALVGGVVRQ